MGQDGSAPSGFRLGRVLGIPIYVHPSWLIIFLLITITLGKQFAVMHPNWSQQQHWALGIITSILFFSGVSGGAESSTDFRGVHVAVGNQPDAGAVQSGARISAGWRTDFAGDRLGHYRKFRPGDKDCFGRGKIFRLPADLLRRVASVQRELGGRSLDRVHRLAFAER